MSEIKNIKLNGTTAPIGGKVFEDVEQLPETPDSNVIYRISSVGGGTVVPNTGLVDKVYFNTKLSTEEVVELIKNSGVTFFDPINQVPSTEQGLYIVYGAVDSKGNMGNGMQLMYGEPVIESMFGVAGRLAILASVCPKDENGDYTENETMLPIFVSDDVPSMGLTAGWQGIESIEIGGTLVNDAGYISVGLENDKLTSLFSLTSNFVGSARYVNIVDGNEFEFANINSIKDDTYYIDITYNQDNTGSNFKAELDKVQLPLDLSEDLIKNGNIVIRVKEIGINLIGGGTYNHYTYYRLTDGKKVPLGGSDESGQPYVLISLSFGNTDRSQAVYQAEAHTINLQTMYTAEDGLATRNDYYNQGVSSSSVTVDTAMSNTSTNPVQNKVIKAYVDEAIQTVTAKKYKKTITVDSWTPYKVVVPFTARYSFALPDNAKELINYDIAFYVKGINLNGIVLDSIEEGNGSSIAVTLRAFTIPTEDVEVIFVSLGGNE